MNDAPALETFFNGLPNSLEYPALYQASTIELPRQELFRCMLAAANDWSTRARPDSIRVYLDGNARSCDLNHFLPIQSDGTVPKFFSRLEKELGQQTLGMMCFGCQRYSWPLYFWARGIIEPLISRLGIPDGGVDVDSFGGNYDATPHGIHQDPTANLSFVLLGRKEYLFWPATTFSGDVYSTRSILLNTRNVAALRRYAQTVIAEPGQVVYWPAGTWHIAISSGEWSATMNVALYFNRPPLARLLAALQQLARPRETMAFLGERELPRRDQESIHELTGLLVRDDFLRIVAERRLRFASAWGFELVPDLDQVCSTELAHEFILSSPSGQILAEKIKSRLIIGANGHLATVRENPEILRALRILNSGSPLRVDERTSAPPSRDLSEVFRFLVAARAIQRRGT